MLTATATPYAQAYTVTGIDLRVGPRCGNGGETSHGGAAAGTYTWVAGGGGCNGKPVWIKEFGLQPIILYQPTGTDYWRSACTRRPLLWLGSLI